MDILLGYIIALDKYEFKRADGSSGWRWVADIEDDNGVITQFSGLDTIPEFIGEAFHTRVKVSVPVVKRGGFINYNPHSRKEAKTDKEASGFKPASEENSPRERAITDARIIAGDARRVFKDVWGFEPSEKSSDGVWAAYNSILIYLTKR